MNRTFLASVALFMVALVLVGQEPPVDDFPVAELTYRDGSRLFYLHSPYGFIAKWEDGSSRFYLYDKARTNITITSKLGTLLAGLSRLPDRAEVAWINTCMAPLYYGMPSNRLSVIHELLKKKRFKMAGIEENNFVLCTCESTNLTFFSAAPPAKQAVEENDGQASPDPSKL